MSPAILFIFVAVLTVVQPSAAAVDRSTTERRHFAQTNPCPANGKAVYSGCQGYTIDHVVPVCDGGPDTASNMQWQAVAISHLKDRIEKAYCECVRKHGADLCPAVKWKATADDSKRIEKLKRRGK